MKKLFLVFALLTTQLSFAAELRITEWYRLDPQNLRDYSAEVCFQLIPAPEKPHFVEVTTDKGTRAQKEYSTWIGTKGESCLIVTTYYGRVEIAIPDVSQSRSKEKFQ